MEKKMKNKVIQRDEFIVKECRRFYVSVLINYIQEFKNVDTEYCYIYDDCLIKYLSLI